MHEAHRMFAEALYSPSGQSPWGKMLRGSGRKRFLSLLTRKLKGFRKFVEAFKRAKGYPDYPVYVLEGGMPMFPVYFKKRKRKDINYVSSAIPSSRLPLLAEIRAAHDFRKRDNDKEIPPIHLDYACPYPA